MASAMDVAVIAEGVETREQARWLRHLGIKLVQGYAFGRPAPAETIEALLRDGLPLEHLALAFEPIAGAAVAAPRRPRGLAAPAAAPGGATVTLGEAAVALRRLRQHRAPLGRHRPHRGRPHERRPPPLPRRRAAPPQRRGRPRAPPSAPSRCPPTRCPRSANCSRAPPASSPPPSRAASTTAPPRAGSAPSPGREQLGHWSAALAAATRGTDYDAALDATRRLVTQADLAGASLLERHTFLERYGEAVVRTLQERGAPHAELVGARRAVRPPAPGHARGGRRASRSLSSAAAAPALIFAWR